MGCELSKLLSKWFDSFNSSHILNLTIVNQVNIERFDDKESACRLLLNTLARYFLSFQGVIKNAAL